MARRGGRHVVRGEARGSQIDPCAAVVVRQVETDAFEGSLRADVAAVAERLLDVDDRVEALRLRVETDAPDFFECRVSLDGLDRLQRARRQIAEVVRIA